MKFSTQHILAFSTIFAVSIVHAQGVITPLLIEQSSTVLGNGIATDLKPKALLGLYQEARKSSMAVSMARLQGRTIILDQDYIVYPSDSNTPTRVKRKVVLNQSIHYGDANDTECAVKILQEGSFDTSGRWLGTSLTHHIEIPKCAAERKPIELIPSIKPAGIVNEKSPIQLEKVNIHLAPMKVPEVAINKPVHPGPIIIPEVKKDCATERKEKVSALYSSDAALKSLESELQNLKIKNSTIGRNADDSTIIQNAAKAIEKYPKLSADLNTIIAKVFKTQKCPTSNTESWNKLKKVSMSLYKQGEHTKIDLIQTLQSQKKLMFWCGYNDQNS